MHGIFKQKSKKVKKETNHGIALAAPGLAVGEQRAIVALPRILQHVLAEIVKHLALRRILAARRVGECDTVGVGRAAVVAPVRVVERKRLALLVIVGICNPRLVVLHLDDDSRVH